MEGLISVWEHMSGHLRALHTHHGLCQSLLDEVDAALVDGLTVWQKATLQGSGYR